LFDISAEQAVNPTIKSISRATRERGGKIDITDRHRRWTGDCTSRRRVRFQEKNSAPIRQAPAIYIAGG
jgi:hypothetical protein